MVCYTVRMGWSFAMVNNRLAEIYFDHKKNGDPIMHAHCYVKKVDFKTERDQRHIEIDTKRYRFTYRNKKYFDQIRKKVFEPVPFDRSGPFIPLEKVLGKLGAKKSIPRP